ncbi:MAG: hypothetical protein M3308_07890 [Actinomycetota bacterium]|nr:hypothetical protein [Actinomycetota bacterium]
MAEFEQLALDPLTPPALIFPGDVLDQRGVGVLEGVGAELVIHGADLRRRWTVVVGHGHPLWRYDCYI